MGVWRFLRAKLVKNLHICKNFCNFVPENEIYKEWR